MSSPADPRVSFFVQAYNSARYIGECLESILRQQSPYAFDVLIIDDASGDGTADEAARFVSDRVRLVRHVTNQGATATASEGYSAATAPFVVRIDSDDRVRPDFLARALPLLLAEPRVGLVYGDIATIDQEGRMTASQGLVRRGTAPAVGDEFFPLLLENYIPAPTTIVRRTALAPLLPIPQALTFVDWYVTTGIAEGWHCAYVDAVLGDYRVHAASMHHTMVADRTGEASSRRVLDALFTNGRRVDEKQRWQRPVYARHYLTYADKYFGSHMNAEARRCYWQAMRWQPALALQAGVARRFAATVVGRRWYEAVKALRSAREERSAHP